MDNNFNTNGVLSDSPLNQAGAAQGNSSWNKMNSGPAALAQALILELLNLYAKIISEQTQQKKAMIKAEVEQARAQSDHTQAEGNAAMTWGIIAGGLTIAGAIGGLAAFAYSAKDADLDLQDSELKTELAPFKQIRSVLSESPEELVSAESELKNAPSDEVQAKMDKLMKGDFSSEGDENNPVNKEAIRRLKMERTKDDKKLDYLNFEKEFFGRLETKQREALEIAQRTNTNATKGNTWKSLADSLGQAGSSISQSSGQKSQSQNRAAASLEGTLGQMEQAEVNTFAGAVGKADQAQEQTVQLLEKMRQAAVVN